jgi:hypothetical protein
LHLGATGGGAAGFGAAVVSCAADEPATIASAMQQTA